MDTEPAPLETKAAKSELANNTTETSSSSDAPHDVPYFRSLLKSETDRLNGLSDKWNTINDSTDNLTEDGKLILNMLNCVKDYKGTSTFCTVSWIWLDLS